MSKETITINGREYQKFWTGSFSNPVSDGTVRCIFCGQVDDQGYHEDAKCCACPEWDGVDRQSAE